MSDKTMKKRMRLFQKLGLCLLAIVLILLLGGAVLWASSPHVRERIVESINPSSEPDTYDVDRAREIISAPPASSKLSQNLKFYEASEW